ncbi:MAG TPA: bifunctional riboflavin kinase/FAD synthetase [Thermomicrobiales bacterium]|nr:bifunctional riboflavin kinase/FAD synthetase [Thermomicrobiales bacterium]
MARDVVLVNEAELAAEPRIVTIGTFDGVHRGHQMLLRRAIERARTRDMRSLALTFEPIPAMVLRPDKFAGRICTQDEKLERLVATGVDQVLVMTFDTALSRQSPEQFMQHLATATNLRELWVGEAFALGKDRAGNVERLTAIGQELGFAVHALPRLTDETGVISSSAIRAAIMSGDAERAHDQLGRPFRVTGEVIHGAHLGREIGYPTANVVPPVDLAPLADGIYVSCATLPGETEARQAMTYVGTRPTVNSGVRLVETHLLDFEGDLYGQTIAVDVLKQLRGDQTFASLEALIEQLRRDEEATRAYFDARASAPRQ